MQGPLRYLTGVKCTAFGPSCFLTDGHTGSCVFSGCEKVACVLHLVVPSSSVYSIHSMTGPRTSNHAAGVCPGSK